MIFFTIFSMPMFSVCVLPITAKLLWSAFSVIAVGRSSSPRVVIATGEVSAPTIYSPCSTGHAEAFLTKPRVIVLVGLHTGPHTDTGATPPISAKALDTGTGRQESHPRQLC